ncbi:hypothetical protein [Hyalangium versicolor]|uniref:hypothetical protein n=1 Tax=Hyalangium versicolor TaxID=2861190 RepID=UPI001CCCB723|nr:hypothetical protein [Hyalangium versicolor]
MGSSSQAAAPLSTKGKKGVTSKGQPQAPQAVVDPLGTVQVMLDGKPATGLFVIFKSLPAGQEGEQNHNLYTFVARLVEGQRPLDGTHPEHEQRFVLGFVDEAGFLQPVLPFTNPWFEIHVQAVYRANKDKAPKVKKGEQPLPPPRSPHCWKLAPHTKLKVCYVRHPSPALARGLTRYLNGEYDLDGYGFEDWGSPDSLLRPVTLKTRDEGGTQVCFDVPEEPGHFYPHGSSRYGSWLLYHGMPHAQHPDVRAAVERLQVDLGVLRYPIAGGTPYTPIRKGDGLNVGDFDFKAMAATHAFQLDAVERKAFQVAEAARGDAHGRAMNASPGSVVGPKGKKYSWAYLLGREISDAPMLAADQIEPGVVDKATASAIEAWISKGLRKPGKILIELYNKDSGAGGGGFEWARPEVTFSLELWRELVHSLGCAYGISLSHTFRDVEAGGGVGKARCSIHKTGLAVDLSMVGTKYMDYSRPVPHWPIRYEAHWEPSPPKPVREAEKAHEKAKGQREAAEEKLDSTHRRKGTAVQEREKALQDARDHQAEAQRLTDEAKQKAIDAGKSPAKVKPARVKGRTADGWLGVISTAQTRYQQAVDELAAIEAPEHPLRMAIAEKEEEERLLKERLEALRASVKPSKADYVINWRLYGHSSLDVFSLSPAEVKKLIARQLGAPAPGLDGMLGTLQIEESFRETLEACFPHAALAKHFINEQVARCRKAAEELLGLSGEDVLRTVFRKDLRQWLYNPFEPDGGKLGPVLTPTAERTQFIDYLNIAETSNMEGTKGVAEAKSFLNLSLLGWHCGLLRIHSQRAGWREPSQDIFLAKPPGPTQRIPVDAANDAQLGLGTIVGLMERMQEAGGQFMRSTVKVINKDRELTRTLDQIDVPFMKAWVRQLHSLGRGPLAARGGNLAATLAVPTESNSALRSLLTGTFSSKYFRLIHAGTLLDLKLSAQPETGADLMARIETAINEFDKQSTEKTREEAEARARADEEASTSPKKKGRRHASKADGVTVKSKPKSTVQWTLLIQPIFDLVLSDAEPLAFIDKDSVEMPTPGVGRALEWWHFEAAVANFGTKWGRLLEDIGYSREVLAAPEKPPELDAARSISISGLGYSPGEDLDSCKGGGGGGKKPENLNEFEVALDELPPADAEVTEAADE